MTPTDSQVKEAGKLASKLAYQGYDPIKFAILDLIAKRDQEIERLKEELGEYQLDPKIAVLEKKIAELKQKTEALNALVRANSAQGQGDIDGFVADYPEIESLKAELDLRDQEIAELKQINKTAHELFGSESDKLACLLALRDKRIEGLREALKKFGVHGYTCNDKGEHRMACPSNVNRCDCGFDAALEERKPEQETKYGGYCPDCIKLRTPDPDCKHPAHEREP